MIDKPSSLFVRSCLFRAAVVVMSRFFSFAFCLVVCGACAVPDYISGILEQYHHISREELLSK